MPQSLAWSAIAERCPQCLAIADSDVSIDLERAKITLPQGAWKSVQPYLKDIEAALEPYLQTSQAVEPNEDQTIDFYEGDRRVGRAWVKVLPFMPE